MAWLLKTDLQKELPRYTSIGGYPLFYLDSSDSVLCADCANESNSDSELDKFRPRVSDINWEDAHLYCDQCSSRIESAYADDEEDEDDE